MKKAEQLHELIHSLTRGEKKQYRIYARQHMKGESSHYLMLFGIYESMTVYDEKKFLSRLKNAKLKKNLTSVHTRLYTNILRYIRQSHQQTLRQQLYETLEYASILGKKELFFQKEIMLRRAAELAERLNEPLLSKMIWLDYLDIATRREDFKFHSWESQEIYRNIAAASEELAIGTDFFQIGRERNIITQQLPSANSENFLRFRNEYDRLQKKYSSNKVAEHQLRMYTAALLLHEGKHEAALREFRIIQTTLEKLPEVVLDKPYTWIYYTDMILHVLSLLGQYDEVKKEIKRCTGYCSSLELEEHDTALNYYFIKMNTNVTLHLFVITGDFSGGYQWIAEHAAQYSKIVAKLGPFDKPVYWYNQLYICLAVKKYREALRCILQLKKPDVLSRMITLQVYVEILSIIVHYELEDYDLVESLCRAADRSFKLSLKAGELERAFVQFSKRNMIDRCAPASFAAFRKEQAALFTPMNKNYFDLESWLESKAKNISFEAAVKQLKSASR